MRQVARLETSIRPDEQPPDRLTVDRRDAVLDRLALGGEVASLFEVLRRGATKTEDNGIRAGPRGGLCQRGLVPWEGRDEQHGRDARSRHPSESDGRR